MSKTTNTQETTPALKFYNELVLKRIAENLYGRWLDEREYEEDGLYIAQFQKVASKYNLIVNALTKRPWGIKFTDAHGRYYTLKVTSKEVSYQRVR